jgi:hypothetical protein
MCWSFSHLCRGLFDDVDVSEFLDGHPSKKRRDSNVNASDPEETREQQYTVLERTMTAALNKYANMCCSGGESVYGELTPQSWKDLAKLLVEGSSRLRFGNLVDLGYAIGVFPFVLFPFV